MWLLLKARELRRGFSLIELLLSTRILIAHIQDKAPRRHRFLLFLAYKVHILKYLKINSILEI